MIKFGDLEVVEKTFTREGGAVRTQAYTGIKFRRYESEKGKKAAQEEGKEFVPFMEEQFVISNKAWEQLGLEENALLQTKKGNQVILLSLADSDNVKPAPKFLRRSFAKVDGAPQKKGKMFSNEFLTADLVSAGVIDATKLGNQYIALQDVTSQVADLPSHVKGAYMLVDESIDAAAAEEEASADANSNEF
jgi:hypothetical protein